MVTVSPGSGEAHSFASAEPRSFCLPESQHTQEGQEAGPTPPSPGVGAGPVVGGARWARQF